METKANPTPCRACGATNCDCRDRLVRLFELLLIADSRVSTIKVASKHRAVNAHLDKVSCTLSKPLPRPVLEARLRESGVPYRGKFLKDRQYYWEVFEGFYIHLGRETGEIIVKFFCRPSAFDSLDQFWSFLTHLFTDEEIDSMRITRADMAIDYEACLHDTLHGLDLLNKQCETRFDDKHGRRSGALFGKGNEKLLVYDKALEANLPGPLTRLELQLQGAKLPGKHWNDLLTSLADSTYFSFVSLANIETLDHPGEIQQKKLRNLENSLAGDGYYAARRKLNQDGNFGRDYKPLLRIDPWPDQPEHSFRKLIASWLAGKSNPDHLLHSENSSGLVTNRGE